MFKAMVLMLALGVSAHVYADDTDSQSADSTKNKVKVEDVNGRKNKVDGDIDQEITNAKMRADSGSKSKWSMSGTASYTGGSVTNAFGVERPNLKGTPDQQVVTSLSGGVNGRYRWTKNDSFTGGVAYGVYTPMQGNVHATENQFNLFDPSIAYNHVAKLGGFQTAMSLIYGYGTSSESRGIDQTNEYAVTYNAMYAFPNKVTFGAQVALSYNQFTSDPGTNKNALPRKDPNAYGKDTRVQAEFAIYPQLEYQINDTFSARTVFGYFNWKHLYGDPNHGRLLQEFVYQSLGIGISVARDVFLYPNVQFLPGDLALKNTNVAMSATLNVF